MIIVCNTLKIVFKYLYLDVKTGRVVVFSAIYVKYSKQYKLATFCCVYVFAAVCLSIGTVQNSKEMFPILKS